MDVVKVMNRLIKAQGVTGHEQSGITGEVSALFREFGEPLGAMVLTDINGNAYAMVTGELSPEEAPVLLVMAHLDEIGMIVTKIEENGMLRMASVAGVDPRVLPGSRVLVCGKKELIGVVGATPPHLFASNKDAYKMEELTVDLGLPYDKVCELVTVGDRVTFEPRDVLELKNGFMASKSFDDRALVAAELYCMELLKNRRFMGRIVFCASVNEEKTGLGAITATYSTKPDMGIVMDVTFGKCEHFSDGFEMDKVALGVGPNLHPVIFKRLKKAADDAKIAYELEAELGATGTDATDVQISRQGVPCGLISPPLRYMHTNVEVMKDETILNCGRLLAQFICNIDKDWRQGLCWD